MKKILFLAFSLIFSAHLWAGYAFDPSTDYYIQGSKAGEQGDYETALYNYKMAIKHDKKNGYAWARAAYIYAVQGDYESALSYFNTSFKYLKVKNAPDFCAWAHGVRSEIYLESADTISALKDLTLAIQSDPENSDWLVRRGELYYDLKDLEKSSRDFRKAMELNPSDYMGFMGYGRNLKIQGNFTDAIPMFTYACNITTDYSYAYAFRAECYLELDETEKAVADIAKALDIDMNRKALFLCAVMPDTVSNLLLLNSLRTIEDNHADDETFNRLMSSLSSEVGDSKNELRYFLKAGTDSVSAEDFLHYSNIESDLGFYNQSISLLEHAVRIYPDEATLFVQLAYSYDELGEYNKAIEIIDHIFDHMESFLAQPMDYTILYSFRGWVNVEAKNYDQAIIDLNKGIKFDSTIAYTYLILANSNEALGQYEEARKYFLKVIELDSVPSEDACAQYAYLFLGDTIRAKEFMELSMENNCEPYEAACFYSLINEKETALKYLRMAFEKGYRRFKHLEVDDDMDNIRNTPEFILLVSEYMEKHEQEELEVFSKFSFKLEDEL